MNFEHVCLESIGYVLPPVIVTSDDLEKRLSPLYERLRLPEGRLELITGITARRFWRTGTLPSEKSIESCTLALQAADWDPGRIGALLHGSVCRDHLEPATACRVHHGLKLDANCVIYDVSNACLGLMNGALQIAQMIELGHIESGLVVGTESSRQLVETTIDMLNADSEMTRAKIKSAIASLTIGSGSCALLLTHRRVSRTSNRLRTVVVEANTRFHDLCHSGEDEAVASGMQPLMDTDSETLMHEGVATGVSTFQRLLSESAWDHDSMDKTICHQVGSAHRRLMLESLQIPLERDFSTVEWLGNTGSVALPTTLAIAAEVGHVSEGNSLGLLGIGSGINSVMMAVEWNATCVAHRDEAM